MIFYYMNGADDVEMERLAIEDVPGIISKLNKGTVILYAGDYPFRITMANDQYEIYDYHRDDTNILTKQQMRTYISALCRICKENE